MFMRSGLFAGLAMLWAAQASAQDVRTNIAIGLDVSGSMVFYVRPMVRSTIDALQSDEFAQAVADNGPVGVMIYSWGSGGPHDTGPVVPWYIVGEEKPDLKAAMAGLRAQSGTQISSGVDFGSQMLGLAPWPAEKMVIDVVTDCGEAGADADNRLRWEREQAERNHITVNFLILREAYVGCADRMFLHGVGGVGGFLQNVDTDTEMTRAMIRKLIREIG